MAQEGYKLDNIEALPVKERRKTDVFCTIFNAIFVVLLFVIFLFIFDAENLRKITYPNDAEGNLCGYNIPKYPYLYFTSLADTSKRLCVSKCPTATDTFLLCSPTKNLSCKKNENPAHEVTIYDSQLEQSRIGLICMPKDQRMKDLLLTQSQTKAKYEFLGFYDSIWRSIWVSIIFAVTLLLFAYFQPYVAVPWTIFIGGVVSVIFGILIFTLAEGYWFVKLLLMISFVGFGVFSFLTIYNISRRESIYICARLIHAAAMIQYDKSETGLPNFLSLGSWKKLLRPMLLVVAFMVLFGAFLVLIAFEILSAWSCAHLVFSPHYPFYEVSSFGSSFLMFLIFVEALWGFSFLKEAFNFIASGYSAHKYFSIGNREDDDAPMNQREPSYLQVVEMLLRYHWGTVVGGALILPYFYFVDLLFDFIFIKPEKIQSPKEHREPIGYNREFEKPEQQGYADKTSSFFNLLREESFAYTYLTSMPYCNSSRYCEFLSEESKFYNNNQIVNRLYRLNLHIIPIFFTLLIAMLLMEGTGKTSPYGILCITLITFFTVTYPLTYQPNTAEGLLISTFVELAFDDEAEEPALAPAIIKQAYRDDLAEEYKYRKGERDERGERVKKHWYQLLSEPLQTE